MRFAVTVPHRDDGCIVDVEDMLNGHSWDLCNKDPSKCICYSWVYANHIKLHVKVEFAVFELHFDTKVLDPFLEVPCIADAQRHEHVGRSLSGSLQ